ncbi:hypothetical protein KKC_06727 [Listeria fleischmannii subsp. coloradonensis]|nr:hypothetical protein KKC_06727 [Listeria fleischmannii subsp. coloradonensis]
MQKSIGEVYRIESRVQGANGIPGDWYCSINYCLWLIRK